MSKLTVPQTVLVSALFLVLSIIASVLIFGSVMVGPVLEEEKPMIEAWIAWENRNYAGDSLNTPYPMGFPVFDAVHDRYDYIRGNNRTRPWQNNPEHWAFALSEFEKPYVKMWIEKENLNMFGDPHDTVYPCGTPLFD